MRIENVNSDLEIVVRFMVGTVEVKIPTHDFCLRFRTAGHYGTYWDCKQQGGALVNCTANNGRTRLTCTFDNHGLRPGDLECEFYDYIPSEDFTDGSRCVVVPCGMDVRLAKDATAPDDVDVDVVLGITSWIASELLAEEYAEQTAGNVFKGFYISSDDLLIKENDAFKIMVFEVHEGEHWRVERYNSSQSTGKLCMLYNDTITEASAFANANDAGVKSCIVLNYNGPGLNKNYPLVVGDEHNEGWDYVIPEGAKWLVVTQLAGVSGTVVSKVGYVNALDKVDEFSSLYDERLENLHEKIKWDVFVPQEYDEGKEHYMIAKSSGNCEYDTHERFYDLRAYHVNSGERWHVHRDGSGDNQPPTSIPIVALYKLERMCDESTGDLLLSQDTYIGIGIGDSTRNNARVGCDETIDIPEGVGLLVVQYTPTIKASTFSVSKNEPVYIKDRIDDIIAGDMSDDSTASQPYTMKAVRSGSVITVLSKPSGSGKEYIFVLGESMANTLMSLKEVHGREPTEGWDMGTSGTETLMNNTSADSIGPIAIRGTNYDYDNFIGGNHLMASSVKTGRTLNWSVVAHRRNGEHAIGDGKEMMCDAVTLKAVNLLSRPATLPATAQTDLLPTLLETVTITLRENRAEVEVRHDYPFALPDGAYVHDYYGMQSAFGPTSSILIKTPDGPLTSWTSEATLATGADYKIKQSTYPSLTQFIQKRSNGWCQSTLLDRWYGIGDRSRNNGGNNLNNDVIVRLATTGKVYHRLVGGKIERGESYCWRGTYSWWKE